jgi:acyl-CoA reductase-like NAD-dependent aldehyde dehydrogenase
MTNKTIEHLEKQIAQLVSEHIAVLRATATAAVERAFSSATATPVKASAPRQRASGRRRPPAEVAGLAERLYEAVRANPGETMEIIAAHVGEPVRALNRPMIQLKSSGRVRSAGQRQFTRYFPMTSKAA